MFSWLFKFCILLVFLVFTIKLVENSKPIATKIKIQVRIGDNANDTILELFQNCTCVGYYECPNILQLMQAGRDRKLVVECSDPTYFCCKNVNKSESQETTTESTADASTTSTTTEKTTVSSTTPTTTISTTVSTTTPTKTKPTTVSSTVSTSTTEIPTLRNVNVTCGLPQTAINVRILNSDKESESTIPGEIPWLVEIFEKKGKKYRFKCAGTLIHPKVILTAQHCVRSNRENSLKILAGNQGIFQDIGSPDIERNVIEIIRHPKYYSGGLYNDIALLILENEFNYADHFLNSICLPSQDQVFNGKRCIGVGWGMNPNHEKLPLKKVDIPIVEFEECQTLLRDSRLGQKFNLDPSFMCAGGEGGKDTCKGDGGGPLICMDDYRFVQVGIISWAVNLEKCGKKGEPGVYTNVAQFTDWINTEVARHGINKIQ